MSNTRLPPTKTPSSKPSYGEMTIAFWPDVAPKTVENFKKLAREGFYNGTAFHRIIKGFMIQGGCPNTKEGANGMPGTGDPGYKIKAEFNAKPHVRGVISMARSAHPDSAGSQFFICHGDARFLDRQYTAFGQLVKGDDVLERIANVPTKRGGGERARPLERVAHRKRHDRSSELSHSRVHPSQQSVFKSTGSRAPRTQPVFLRSIWAIVTTRQNVHPVAELVQNRSVTPAATTVATSAISSTRITGVAASAAVAVMR
ncbi:MAG: peptidylprolyl isomerase [Nibricoccus sp.]